MNKFAKITGLAIAAIMGNSNAQSQQCVAITLTPRIPVTNWNGASIQVHYTQVNYQDGNQTITYPYGLVCALAGSEITATATNGSGAVLFGWSSSTGIIGHGFIGNIVTGNQVSIYVPTDYPRYSSVNVNTYWDPPSGSPNTSIDGFQSSPTGKSFTALGRIEDYLGGWIDFPNAQYVPGDFNNDGLTDIARIFNDNGFTSIDVLVNNGNGTFTCQRWVTQSGAFNTNQWYVAGNFDGQNGFDIARILPDNGNTSVDVFTSTNSSFNPGARWTTRNGGNWAGQQYVAGDFDGDGKWDIARVWGSNGSSNTGNATIDVLKSTGTTFSTSARWANNEGGFTTTQHWFAGYFDGDAKMDLAKVFNDNGYSSIDVHLSNGSVFNGPYRRATQNGGFWDTQKWCVGDFNNDNLWDFANIFGANGVTNIDVHTNNGSAFSKSSWITNSGAWSDGYSYLPGKWWPGKWGILRILPGP